MFDFLSVMGEFSRNLYLKLDLMEDILKEDYKEVFDKMKEVFKKDGENVLIEGFKKIFDFLEDWMLDVKMKVFQVCFIYFI